MTNVNYHSLIIYHFKKFWFDKEDFSGLKYPAVFRHINNVLENLNVQLLGPVW